MIDLMAVISEVIIFALYIFICLALLKPRFSFVLRALVYGGVVLCSCALSAALAPAGNGMAALTLLPLTAYLPFSVCLYILSENGLAETVAACSVGVLAAIIMKSVKKLLTIWLLDAFTSPIFDIALVGATLILASVFVYAAFRYMREPFKVCVRFETKKRSLLFIPEAAAILMIFDNFNSTSTAVVVVVTLLAAVSVFVMAAAIFGYSAKMAQMSENEKKLSESLNLQRRNFEYISQNVEAGRHYRHDMRHHLRVLSGMAQLNRSDEILKYIDEISSASEFCEPEMCSKNSVVNAVVSEYISRAKKLGFEIKHKIMIPEELPFESPDVCIILSNALENAMNACEKCPEDKRRIDLLADFSDDSRLKINVRNSCLDIVELDNEGLPVVKDCSDGHGIGLRGVKKVAEKYNGFICCACEKDEFVFCAEIFRDPNGGLDSNQPHEYRSKHSKALPAVMTAIVCVVGLLNFSPAAASALSDIFSVKIKTISYGWGDNWFNVNYPEFSGDGSAKPNQAVRDFVAEAEELFRTYTLQKYEGYVALDAGYRVYVNDKTYLSARFYATVNLGGSADYSRCINFDKRSGEELALADLFEEGYDYIGAISAEVLRQMEERVKYGRDYFIPGGIWSDDECFKEISPEQEFYINPEGLLVIVFDEYTVAPGSEGSPEFIMPEKIFKYSEY